MGQLPGRTSRDSILDVWGSRTPTTKGIWPPSEARSDYDIFLNEATNGVCDRDGRPLIKWQSAE